MNFDDHDWELGHPSNGEVRDASTLWKVAAGVAFGMVLGGVLVYAFDGLWAPSAVPLPSVERMLRSAEPTAADRPSPLPPPAETMTVPPAQEPKAAPGQAAIEAAATTDGERETETEAAQRAAQRAAERKERAWARFYQAPAQCDENPPKATMVECANHYIRARRQFEQSYGTGRR